MAGEQEQNQQSQTTQTEPTAGNQQEARLPTGELKDQNNLIPSSGATEKTSSDESQNSGKSFLNREPEAKPEAKPEGTDGKAPKTEGEPKTQAAPEKYADFTVPDGVKLDDKTMESATAVFKELGLSQDAAQKLVDIYIQNGVEAAEAPYKLWADTQNEWVQEIQDNFGSKADGMRNDINKGIEAAFTPKQAREFRAALDFTGAGSNPAMFAAFHTLFKPFIESQPVKGNGPAKEGQTAPKSETRPSVAEAMYPHLIQNRGQS